VAFQFHLSPFVSLTALSAIVFLLIPNDFIYSSQQQNPKGGGELLQYFTGQEEFCCGGGPFSFYAASIVSIPCERHLSEWIRGNLQIYLNGQRRMFKL
jgi:hypothetical protein